MDMWSVLVIGLDAVQNVSGMEYLDSSAFIFDQCFNYIVYWNRVSVSSEHVQGFSVTLEHAKVFGWSE